MAISYIGEQIMLKRNFINRYTPVDQRVLERTKKGANPDDCWLWCGPVNNAGYGLIKGDTRQGDARMVTVHRVMARANGLNIKWKEVQHTCLVKNCVNPDHLVLGDTKSRHERIVEKYGKNFQRPKKPYKTCPHCGVKTHVVWFSRLHKDCHPGMKLDKKYAKKYQKFV
jgi:hypothetical protein